MSYRIVVIGCSWGGFTGLREILNAFPADFSIPIVVAQHRMPDPHEGLARALQSSTALALVDAADKEHLLGGAVYLAPSDYHAIIDGQHIALSTEASVQYARPSIDVLFESAADSFGRGVVAAILTGANEDGAQGLRKVKEKGGFTIVQDPETAIRREMPDAALAAVTPEKILPLDEIGPFIVELCLTPAGDRDGS